MLPGRVRVAPEGERAQDRAVDGPGPSGCAGGHDEAGHRNRREDETNRYPHGHPPCCQRRERSDHGIGRFGRCQRGLQRCFVEPPPRDPGETRAQLRRAAARDSRLHELADRGDGLGVVRHRSGHGTEDEGDLALGSLAHPGGDLRGGPPHDLLEALRELSADGDRAVRLSGRERAERHGKALRRLEGDDGIRTLRKLLPERFEGAAATREVADELVALADEAARDERRLHRGRARQNRDLDAGVQRRPHEPRTRVADPGKPRVAHERDALPSAQARQHLGRPGGLVVLVVREQACADAVAAEQGLRPAGVLAEDDVRLGELAQDAQRDVLEVPDRRRADRERHAAETPSSASKATSPAPTRPAAVPSSARTILTRSRAGGGAPPPADPPSRRDRRPRRGSSCRRGRRRSRAAGPRDAATILRRMARTDKPYRVYRGGRVRGGVPLRTKPARPEAKDGEDRYRGPSKPARERKRWGWGRRIGVGLALFVLLLVVWTLAGYLSFRGGVGAANKRVSPGTKAALDSQDGLLLSHATDILLLGSDHSSSDARAGDRHSDSIMLVRTDPSHHRIIYLSIPRDLRVPIPGHGDSKINAAFQIGGPALAIRTVRHFTGLPINHVVTVDFGSFKQLIDDVGGVDIDVPENILSNRFDCPYASQARCQRWPGWRFRKGKQHMNGQRALIYSRIRENRLNPSESDVTRAERQQQVLNALMS